MAFPYYLACGTCCHMGRSIPSATARVDAKIAEWSRAARLLDAEERTAFSELLNVVKNHRTALEALDEPDISVSMLLLMLIQLKAGEVHERPGGLAENGPA